MQSNRITAVETRLPSACILAIPMLYVRPSFGCVTITYVSTEVGCVPEAWEGRLFCRLAFVCWFVCLQMCLTWCVGIMRCYFNMSFSSKDKSDIFILFCSQVSRSLKVTVLSTRVSWSTVIQNGVPISSILAYRFPIEPFSS